MTAPNPLTYKALAALLTYPEEPLVEALEEIARGLGEESLLAGPVRRRLYDLLNELQTTDLITLQERYIGLFDRSRTLSLHLYEHVHGESRDRGQAMVTLANLYREHGLTVAARELPDFLPMVCEFLSLIEPAKARGVLADAAHILEAMRRRLEQRDSRYEAVFAALVTLADAAIDAKDVETVLNAESDDDSLEALDEAWAEEPVTFGAGSALAGCPHYPRATTAAPSPLPSGRGLG